MKIYGSILAICLLQSSVAAFTVQAPKATTTELYSSYPYGGVPPPNGKPPAAAAAAAEKVKTNGAAPGIPPPMAGKSPLKAGGMQLLKNIMETSSAVTVQGGSLRTYSFATPEIERAQLMLKTEGRPLNANIELWHGPDNTPQKMNIYCEDGNVRPFRVVVETPRNNNAVAIRNTGHLEFPLAAWVEPDAQDMSAGFGAVTKKLAESSKPRTIQGGALHTYPFDPSVSSVQLLLRTDGRPLNARIELLQGPNNNKQVMEIYTEDGNERPFFCVIETPGTGNVVRVVNTATVEFPLYANVEPYLVQPGLADSGGRGWDEGGASSFPSNRLGW